MEALSPPCRALRSVKSASGSGSQSRACSTPSLAKSFRSNVATPAVRAARTTKYDRKDGKGYGSQGTRNISPGPLPGSGRVRLQVRPAVFRPGRGRAPRAQGRAHRGPHGPASPGVRVPGGTDHESAGPCLADRGRLRLREGPDQGDRAVQHRSRGIHLAAGAEPLGRGSRPGRLGREEARGLPMGGVLAAGRRPGVRERCRPALPGPPVSPSSRGPSAPGRRAPGCSGTSTASPGKPEFR